MLKSVAIGLPKLQRQGPTLAATVFPVQKGHKMFSSPSLLLPSIIPPSPLSLSLSLLAVPLPLPLVVLGFSCKPLRHTHHSLSSHSFIQPVTPNSRPMPPFPQPTTAAQVVFSSDVKNMDEWAKRTGIPLTTAEALGATYARAHRWLLSLKTQLIQNYNWNDSRQSDRRLLFSIDSPSIWRSASGLPASPSLTLQLPLHAGSFFSPDRRVQWEMVFHSDIFQTNRKLCPPINDLLSLLQCLLTGMVTLVFEENLTEGVYRTTRGLPSVEWINANETALVDIFGTTHFKDLWKACNSMSASYKLDVVSHQR